MDNELPIGVPVFKIVVLPVSVIARDRIKKIVFHAKAFTVAVCKFAINEKIQENAKVTGILRMLYLAALQQTR